MASYLKYEPFVESLCNKLIDAYGPTDTWKAIIHTDDTALTSSVVGSCTQIAGANGYTTGGDSITFTSSRSGGTVTATATDVTWTASGGNLGSPSTGARYFSIYDDTSASDNLLCKFDYGTTFTVASGETMTLDFGASLWQLT